MSTPTTPTQIPLAKILQEDGLLSQPQTPAATSLVTATAAPAAAPQVVAPAPISSLPQFQREPINPDLMLKFCTLGLGALAVFGGVFSVWLHRPVQAKAQADLMRNMGQVLHRQQAQVESTIATAQPPQYHCNALIGGCHFPEQEQTRIVSHQPSAPQTPQDRFELPDSLGRSVAIEAATPAPNRFELHMAQQYLRDWDSQGLDAAAVGLYIQHLRRQPDPTMPSPEAFSSAYTTIYGATL